jgi:hypothetical protein
MDHPVTLHGRSLVRTQRIAGAWGLLGLVLFGLSGCNDAPRSADVSIGSAKYVAPAIPQLLLGTWVLVKSMSPDSTHLTDPTRTGFIALGNEQVVIAVPEFPNVVANPVTVTIDGTTHCGCIVLADGVRLYLTTGTTLVEQPCSNGTVVQPMTYLDVAISGASRTGTGGAALPLMRLWSDRSLVCPIMHALPSVASTSAPRAVDSIQGDSASIRLRGEAEALEEPQLQNAIQELLNAAAQGTSRSDLERIAERATCQEQQDILTRLQLAYAAGSAVRLQTSLHVIVQHQASLEAFEKMIARFLERT